MAPYDVLSSFRVRSGAARLRVRGSQGVGSVGKRGVAWVVVAEGVGCLSDGVRLGGVLLVAGSAGGVLREEETEDDQALGFGTEGDHAAVPQGAVELREA